MFLKLVKVSLLLSVVSANNELPGQNFFDAGVFDEDLHRSLLDPETCQQHLREMSSFEFYDASFRVPEGMLQGNFRHFGNFHQCLAIDQELTETNHIRGKHCMITIDDVSATLYDIPWPQLSQDALHSNISQKIEDVVGELKKYERVKNRLEDTELGRTSSGISLTGFRLGVCIPAACTAQEALQNMFDGQLVRVEYSVDLCRLQGDKPRVAADYVAIVVFSLIGLLTIISTAYDVRHTVILQKDPKELNKLYSCGSVYTNTRNLFTFSSKPGAMNCLDGIRSLSTLWVIVGHTVINTLIGGYQNTIEAYEWRTSLPALWFQATDISVDSFFFLAALLLVYTRANKLSRGGLLKNLHHFYLNRLLRIFPILATAVLLQVSFMNRIADGAHWSWQGQNVESCRKYWWAALLHIQNYYNSTDMCLPHTWYLSVDIQLYLVSPIVLFWVLGGRKSGWAGVSIAFLVSLTASTLYVFLVVSRPDKAYKINYYENTLTRAPVFFVGIFFGYLLHDYRNKKLVLALWQVAVGWLASMILLSGAVYAYHPTNQTEFNSQLYTNIYESFNRTQWAIGLGWVVLACVHGYGGPINWFLSLTVFKFLGRISYAMYIFHYPMQFIWSSSVVRTLYFSVPNVLWRYTTDVAVAIVISIVATVVIDAPSSVLQRMLLGDGMQKPKPKVSPADDEMKTSNNGTYRSTHTKEVNN